MRHWPRILKDGISPAWAMAQTVFSASLSNAATSLFVGTSLGIRAPAWAATGASNTITLQSALSYGRRSLDSTPVQVRAVELFPEFIPSLPLLLAVDRPEQGLPQEEAGAQTKQSSVPFHLMRVTSISAHPRFRLRPFPGGSARSASSISPRRDAAVYRPNGRQGCGLGSAPFGGAACGRGRPDRGGSDLEPVPSSPFALASAGSPPVVCGARPRGPRVAWRGRERGGFRPAWRSRRAPAGTWPRDSAPA